MMKSLNEKEIREVIASLYNTADNLNDALANSDSAKMSHSIPMYLVLNAFAEKMYGEDIDTIEWFWNSVREEVSA